MKPSDHDDLSPEPAIGTLRVADGVRLDDAAPHAVALTPPPRVARSRQGERLFILLDLTAAASLNVYWELCELIARTYWFTGGSITASLRRAVDAANRRLFKANLQVEPSLRCYGGLTCVVQSGEEIFILQAGPACAFVLREGSLRGFPRDERLSPLGVGPVPAVRLSHTFVTAGDTLLLVSAVLLRESGEEAIARVLHLAGVEDVLKALQQVGAVADFAALVVRWTPSSVMQAERAAWQPVPERALETPAAGPGVLEPRPEAPVPVSNVSLPQSAPPLPAPRTPAQVPSPVGAELPRRQGPTMGARVGRGLRSAGRGLGAAGVWLGGAAKTLFRRMLPGPERDAYRRARPPRPVPRENRPLMMSIAICIPLLVIVLVSLTYRGVGTKARLDTLVKQALAEAALAEDAGGATEEARPHWEAVLTPVAAAADLRPDEPAILELKTRAQTALDRLDGVVRLSPRQLYDFGPGTASRQLVVRGQSIFVLDPAGGWVAQLAMTPAGDVFGADELAPVLVRTGQQIGGAEVGDLIDFVWVDLAGGRQTSGVVILEEGGALISYDPAWGDESGAPHLMRSVLGTPPQGRPISVGSFEGRFYILDPEANQIWRYEPRGDLYPDQPSRYFATPPLVPLASALDMAIDGHIYVLYPNGEIYKFLLGEQQDFDVRGVPGGMNGAVALAVDPGGSSGALYVADRGNRRVVKLAPDGAFQAQFCPEGVFDDLEAVAVDEPAGRLYVMAGGKLYVAAIP